MDWAAADRRSDPDSLEGQVFGELLRLSRARRALPALRAGGETAPLDVGNRRVLAWRCRHPRGGIFVGVANVSAEPQGVDADAVTGYGTFDLALSSDGPLPVEHGRLLVPPLGFAWFAEP
jgi:amylosucrase